MPGHVHSVRGVHSDWGEGGVSSADASFFCLFFIDINVKSAQRMLALAEAIRRPSVPIILNKLTRLSSSLLFLLNSISI
jgi:hypothetical protein